jgi:hypothetical protein
VCKAITKCDPDNLLEMMPATASSDRVCHQTNATQLYFGNPIPSFLFNYTSIASVQISNPFVQTEYVALHLPWLLQTQTIHVSGTKNLTLVLLPRLTQITGLCVVAFYSHLFAALRDWTS